MHFKRTAHGLRRAPHPAPPERPRRRRRVILLRLLGWLILIGLLLGAALGFYLVFHPWSSPLLDRRIQQAWLKATGIPLTYDKATYQLSQGTVEVLNPALLDPAGGATLLTLGRIQFELPFQQFFRAKPPFVIRAINIDSSLTVPLLLQGRRVVPAPPLDRLATLIRERIEQQRQPAARRGKVAVALGTVRLGTVSVQLSREQGGPAQSLAALNNATLNADFGGQSLPRQVSLDGSLNRSGRAHDLHLVLRPDFARRTADCRLELDQFDSLDDLPWRLPVEFNTAALSLAARVEQLAAGRWGVRGVTTLNDVMLRGADAMADQPLGRAEARYDLALDLAARRLDLTSASLASRICNAGVSGSLGLADPYPYTLAVNPLEAQGPVFALIADVLGHGSEVLRPGETSIRIQQAALHGNLRQKAPQAVTGRLELAGLNLHSPSLPPLDNLHLRADMTTETLQIESARAIVQGMPLAFSGRIRGHALRGEIRSADVTWKANGDLVSIATILKGGKAAPPAQLHLSGKVAGEGRFQVREPLAGSLVSMLERSRLEGRIDLKNVTIEHPGLMEPVRRLNGRIDLVENTARLRGGTGQWMGVDVKLSGSMKGKPQIWNKPRLALTGSADFDLAKTRGRLTESSPQLRQRLAGIPAMAGLADLDFTLDADPKRLAAADYQLTLNLKDFATAIDTPYCGGPLNLSQLSLALTPARFRIARATGRWGELAVTAEGDLAPAGGTLNLTTRGDIHELERRIPIFDRFFNTGGAASTNASFEVRPRKGFTPPQTWQEWWTALQGQPRPTDWPRWVGERWSFDGGGVINARNIEFTYAAMPARLTGISGTARFDMRHLWTPDPLPVSGGERSRGCLGSIDLVYGDALDSLLQGRSIAPTEFSYQVTGGHVALDEWLQPWHFHRQPARPGEPPEQLLPFDPAHPARFKLRGEIKTPSAAYKGVAIRNFHCALDLDVTPKGYENQFLFRDITGQIGAGDFRVDGRNSGDLACDIKAKMIDLEPFIKGLTGKEHVSGLFSGKISGWMQLQQGRGSFADTPLDGRGEIEIVESRFVSNKIFNSLGGILKLPIFQDISFSNIAGPFSMRDSKFSTPGMVFRHPLMHLNAVGAYGPKQTFNMQLQIQLLAKGLERVPLFGQALDLFNKMIGRVVRVNVRGTADNPQISVL